MIVAGNTEVKWENMTGTRRMKTVLVASLLVATTVGLGGSAQAADVAATECDTSIMGQDVNGYLHQTSSVNGTITQHYTTAEPIAWSPRAQFDLGHTRVDGNWRNTYLSPSTDGNLRLVDLSGTEGVPTLTAEVRDSVASDWRPYVMPSGVGFRLYTIRQDGTILSRNVIHHSDGTVSLSGYVALPVKLANTKAAGVILARTAEGKGRDIIYATNGETGALRQVIIDPTYPESTRSYTLAGNGFQTFTHLKTGYCGEAAISVVGVNSTTGNARWLQHTDPFAHSGSTMSARKPVGTDGQWRGWTGIG
jgi:hypothetical protein